MCCSTGRARARGPGELGPQDMLAARECYVVGDASSIFEASFSRPALIEGGCNIHGRRYFTGRSMPATRAPAASGRVEEALRGRGRAARA